MRQCRATEHENSEALRMLSPLVVGEEGRDEGERSSNLIFGIVGSYSCENRRSFRAAARRLLLLYRAARALYRALRPIARAADFERFSSSSQALCSKEP